MKKTIFTILITALISGGAVYFWQADKYNQEIELNTNLAQAESFIVEQNVNKETALSEPGEYTLTLDSNLNFIDFTQDGYDYYAKNISLKQGQYKISLETDFNYALGYDFAYNNKVVLSAVTNGDPYGHVWVLSDKEPLILDLYDTHSPDKDIKLWAFFSELGPVKDNRGQATIKIEEMPENLGK